MLPNSLFKQYWKPLPSKITVLRDFYTEFYLRQMQVVRAVLRSDINKDKTVIRAVNKSSRSRIDPDEASFIVNRPVDVKSMLRSFYISVIISSGFCLLFGHTPGDLYSEINLACILSRKKNHKSTCNKIFK